MVLFIISLFDVFIETFNRKTLMSNLVVWFNTSFKGEFNKSVNLLMIMLAML